MPDLTAPTTSTSGDVDVAYVPASRLAALEQIETAAREWLRAWTGAQHTLNTHIAFDASKRLAATIQANARRSDMSRRGS